MNAPIVMISYNRPDLVRMTLRNVLLADGAQERDVFMFIDGPRNESDEERQDAIEGISMAYQDKLPRLKIIRRPRNLGCRGNVVDAVGTVLGQYGRAVIIEDDILISRTFLRYMDQALEFYRDDGRIWCVNGFQNPHLRIPKDYPCDLYLNPVNMGWGWGTWRDRWEAVDFDLADWPQRRTDERLIARLNRAGRHLVSFLDRQLAGELKAWDVQCTYHVVKNDLRCVEPVRSLTKNIGFSVPGEHFSTDIPVFSRQRYYNFLPRLQKSLPEDDRISRQFAFALSPPRNPWQRILRKCQHELARFSDRHMEPFGCENMENMV